MREQKLSIALSPRALLVGGRGQPGPLIRARRTRRQLLAFTLATILELCFMLTLCYYSQNYSCIIIASLLVVYRIHSNLRNILIIGTPNFNYLICSNSWNEWIFEINNHSNRSNEQVLLSFIFSCYNVSRLYYQLLPVEHYIAGNLQSAWNEWTALLPSAFISPPWVRKCQSKRLNSLDRWPKTVVLLLLTLRITTSTAILSVNQGHDLQLATITAEDVHPWESPQHTCKL